MAAAALAAVPLADAGVKYAAEISKSIVAQLSDALRTPLLGTETTTVRQTRRGMRTTTTKAAIPAWVAVAGGLMAMWWLSPPGSAGHGGGGGGGGAQPWWLNLFDPLHLWH